MTFVRRRNSIFLQGIFCSSCYRFAASIVSILKSVVFPAIRLALSSVIYSRITLYIFALNHICSKSRHSYSKSRHFCFKSYHFRSKSHHCCFKYKIRCKSLFVSAFNLEPATNSITLALTEFCDSATNYSIPPTFPGSAKTVRETF